MRATVRLSSSQMRAGQPQVSNTRGDIHLWRQGGVGDLIFMQPAILRLKAVIEGNLVHHASENVRWLSRRIGFDELMPHEDGEKRGPGMDLEWSLENHPTMLFLDRASIWELVLGLSVSNMPVELARPTCEPPRMHRSTKPRIYFSPWTSGGYLGRSTPPSVAKKLVDALKQKYQVLTCFSGEPQPQMEIGEDVRLTKLNLEQWAAAIATCEVALSNDTGGLYLAAGMGVPTVGIYDHVAPWLRFRRFRSATAIWLRDPICNCTHHDHCPRTGEGDGRLPEPCKLKLDADDVIDKVANCEKHFGVTWAPSVGKWLDPPLVSIRRETGLLSRGDMVALGEVLAGVAYTTLMDGDIEVTVAPGNISKKQLWLALQEALTVGHVERKSAYSWRRSPALKLF